MKRESERQRGGEGGGGGVEVEAAEGKMSGCALWQEKGFPLILAPSLSPSP